MTMNPNLLFAILSMDSYNRGYGAGLKFGANSDSAVMVIGNVSVASHSSDDPNSTAVAAGFYAISYTVNSNANVAGLSSGQTIIAYRGSDSLFGTTPVIGNPVNEYAPALRAAA